MRSRDRLVFLGGISEESSRFLQAGSPGRCPEGDFPQRLGQFGGDQRQRQHPSHGWFHHQLLQPPGQVGGRGMLRRALVEGVLEKNPRSVSAAVGGGMAVFAPGCSPAWDPSFS